MIGSNIFFYLSAFKKKYILHFLAHLKIKYILGIVKTKLKFLKSGDV